MSRSVKLVRTATRPSRVRPNHVPPASASRPARIWGWSSHQWHSRVGRAKNSSRFTARTTEHGARAAPGADGFATKRNATHMGPRGGPRAPRDGRPTSENAPLGRCKHTVDVFIGRGVRRPTARQRATTRDRFFPSGAVAARGGQETTAPDHPSREYPRRFDRQDVFHGARRPPHFLLLPRLARVPFPGDRWFPSHFPFRARFGKRPRVARATRVPPPRPPRRPSTVSPTRADERTPASPPPPPRRVPAR